MADIAASVLARLKNKAAESGRTYQLCLQLFCQEEFLRRLEKSKYADNLILKGGLFIYSVTNFDSRVTVDVDFLLRKIPNTPEQLKLVLEEIIGTSTGNDFIGFEIKNVAPIAVAKKYTGIGVSIVARIKNTRTPFSIDFGVGDVIVPKQDFTVGQFGQVIGFVNDEAMQKKWNAFCRKIDTDTEDYGIVLRKINHFLAKPFMAAVTDNDLTEHWISSVNEWRKKGVSYG